jgi:hypothetical protein
MTNETTRFAKLFRVGGLVLILLFLVGGTVYYFRFKKAASQAAPAEITQLPIPENKTNTFVNDVSGVQDAKSPATKVDAAQPTVPANVSQSEHYAIREITFGGYEIDMSGEVKNAPLQITDVKGETLISKDGKQTRLLFSWKTNKLATSDVTYAKNDGPVKTTLSEAGPGFSHALILNFEPATRYTYSITAHDSWGNTVNSEKFSAFTSTKSDNVIDLITSQFKQMFSWIKQ